MRTLTVYEPDILETTVVTWPDGSRDQVNPGQRFDTREQALHVEVAALKNRIYAAIKQESPELVERVRKIIAGS